MSNHTRRTGMTVLELLVTLAVLAMAAGFATLLLGGGSAHGDAAALARSLASARWLAVGTGEPLTLMAQDDALHMVRGSPLRCDRDPEGPPVWERSRPGAWHWPAMGLAFGPHGRPLRCDGSAVGNTTITLSGRDGSRAAVVVASLGRVRWERR